ncbi:MAG: hydrogenase accessory protein [Steroidobacteraceae bacterium]
MSELLEELAAHPACEIVRKAGLDAFLAQHPLALLFFTGDVRARPEGLDVAVVVRELANGYQDRLRVGIVDRRDESALMTRFGVVVTPAVVYVRAGQPAELVARMRDWPVFAQAADRLLAAAAPDASVAGTGGSA